MIVDDGVLASVRRYCVLDGGDEMRLAELIYAAAADLRSRGVPEPAGAWGSADGIRPLYELALKAMVLYYHDHPDTTGETEGLPPGVRQLVNQLRIAAVAEQYRVEE